ncbi:unnamed protein product [Tilletia controversa]|nr:unnamed protein product [Tilletia controversa]
MRWYPTGGQAAVPQSEDLIDLTTDLTNPFRGFQYVPTAYAGQGAQAAATASQYLPDHAASFFSAPPQLSSTPHGQAPSVAADTRRQETSDVNESLDFLAGAGFELSDPVLAAALQDPTLTTTLAKYVEQALVTQERARTTETSARGSTVAFADEIGSHAAGQSGGSRPQARSASSILTPSRASIHRLPQGVVGGMALNRPIGSNDKGLQHSASPGILRKGPSQEPDPQGMRSTPARALFETRPIVRAGEWPYGSGGPGGPAQPGVPFDPRYMPPPPGSMGGSYGSGHPSQGQSGSWAPRIKPSVEYAGEADREHFESFVFDLQRVFRTYPDAVPEASKVAVLGGQLTDKALTFFNSKDYYYSDWQTVCEELQTRFLPLDTPELNWERFWKVHQWGEIEKKVRPIMEVIQELESMQFRLGRSCNAELMRIRLLGTFSNRMNEAMIQVRVDTYDELRGIALQTDQRRQQIQRVKDERVVSTSAVRDRLAADGKKKRAYTATQVLTAASAVGVGASSGTKSFRTGAASNGGVKLTAEQLAQHLREGLCFGCSQPGHVKVDCPRTTRTNHSFVTAEDDGLDDEPEQAESHVVRLVDKPGQPPVERDGPRAFPLKLMLNIGGKLAYTLVDDGCTHNLIRPTFGSINHWTQLDTQSPSGGVLSSEVFQLVALDGYDAFVSVDWIKRNLLVHRDSFAVWANGEVQVVEGSFDKQEAEKLGERYSRALMGEFFPTPEVEMSASTVLLPGLKCDQSGLVVTSERVPLATRKEITLLLEEFDDTFQDGASDELPPLREGMNHKIPLVDTSLTPNTRLYKMPDAFLAQFYALSEKHLRSGTWVRGAATGAASIMSRPKPSDPSVARFVSDLRQRNANTVKDQYAPPDQEGIRNEVCRSIQRDGGVCTALDMPDGYHQVRNDPDDVAKTATRTPIGIILWLVMQQGDTNAGATFKRNMDVTLAGGELVGARAYLDNIYIYTKVEDHVEALRWVLTQLRKHQWKVSYAKAEIARDDLEVLGFRVNSEGIHVDGRKAWDIIKHPEPKDVKQLQSFLGMVNYLCDRMPEVALLAVPLTEIATQGARFHMTPTRKEAFARVKSLVSNTVALSPISPPLAKSADPEGRVWVVADASVSGVGGWIGQGRSHDAMRPAGFFSKKYTAAQSNWGTPDQELLALIATMNAFRTQLLGVPLTLVTDSKTASRLQDKAELKGKSWRWADFISEFHVREIIHVPRTRNSLSDYLSKLAGDYPEAFSSISDEIADPCRTEDETGRLAFHGEKLVAVESQATEVEDGNGGLDWNEAYRKDGTFEEVVAHPERFENLYRWNSEAGMLYVRRTGEPELLVVPAEKRSDVIKRAHVTVGHQGARYTVENVRRRFWWPSLVKDVIDFCSECDPCQRSKSTSQSPAGLLRALTVPRGAWKDVAIDFVGPFPAGKSRNDFLMVTIDRASTQVRLAACKTRLTGEDAAELYLRTVYALHGWPRSVVSDRDPRFTGAFWQALMRSTGVDLKMSTAAHPETDGQAEAANKTVVQVLRTLLMERRLPQADWEQLLPHVEFAMNSSINRSLGMTPLDFVYGETPSAFPDPTSPIETRDASSFVSRLGFLRDWAWDGVLSARTAQTKDANRSRREDPGYPVGSRVLLSTVNLRLKEDKRRPWAAKLLPKWVGPFAVVRSTGPTYELELPTWLRVHPVLHTRLLKAWKGPDNASPPAPHHDAFESDATPICVADHRDVGAGKESHRQLLVRWRGNDNVIPADTWENGQDVVDHFPDLPANNPHSSGLRRSARLATH